MYKYPNNSNSAKKKPTKSKKTKWETTILGKLLHLLSMSLTFPLRIAFTWETLLEADVLMDKQDFAKRISTETPAQVLSYLKLLADRQSISDNLHSILKMILGDPEQQQNRENINKGACCLGAFKVPVSPFPSMYQQTLDMQRRMLLIASYNEGYQGPGLPNLSNFDKVESMPAISALLRAMLKSKNSPPNKSLFLLGISDRPVLGPFKAKVDGCVYLGQFESGMPSGLTFYVNQDGEFYFGQCQRGEPDGIGFFGSNSGDTYYGQFRGGIWHGMGVERYSGEKEGNVYHGQFQGGAKKGHTNYKFADGREYTGDWEGGFPHGKGVMKLNAWDRYEGDWVRGRRHGKGKYFR